MRVLVLSIDAWADGGGGWTWNDHRRIDTVHATDIPDGDRALLAFMRDHGWLSDKATLETVMVTDAGNAWEDGNIIEFCDSETDEPLFALSTSHGS